MVIFLSEGIKCLTAAVAYIRQISLNIIFYVDYNQINYSAPHVKCSN